MSLQYRSSPNIVAFLHSHFFLSNNDINSMLDDIGILNSRIILHPRHLPGRPEREHWVLFCCDTEDGMINVFDSLNQKSSEKEAKKVAKSLTNYCSSKGMNKIWSVNSIRPKTPQQENGIDCGVFTCAFARYLVQKTKFDFTQEHIPYLRLLISYELKINGFFPHQWR